MSRKPLLAATVLLLGAGTAFAHHGWNWTADEESRLAGRIETIFLGNPHPRLKVAADDGVWEVDLATPSATRAAGFVEGVAKTGDRASFTGHRSRDPNERVFKAETVTVNNKTYDVYPNREKTLKPEA